MLPQLGPMFQAGIAALRPLLEAELARRAADTATAAEPDVPSSAGRFLTAPVDTAAVRSS
jgi:hypothetical protein